MILHIDHVTVLVRDVAEAKAFFAFLGFVEEKSVIISGGLFARYIRPERLSDEDLGKLARPGYNHISFAVKDLEVEVKRLTSRDLGNISPLLISTMSSASRGTSAVYQWCISPLSQN
jgi:catechol 2,3-dioxygenase-like lactoylglutathione lyase family enzyme